MINAVIAIELEAYLEHDGQIGSPLANPARHPTSHQLPHSAARLHPAHLGGLNTANQACGHTPFSNPLTK